MPPKKRDKDGESNKNSKIDHLQADHELFLQAFESKFDEQQGIDIVQISYTRVYR